MVYVFLLVILPLTYLGGPLLAAGMLADRDHTLSAPLRNFLFFGSLAWMEAVAYFIYIHDSPGGNALGWLKLVSLATGLTLALALAFNPWFRFQAYYRRARLEFDAKGNESVKELVLQSIGNVSATFMAASSPNKYIDTVISFTKLMFSHEPISQTPFPPEPPFSVCLNPKAYDSIREEIDRALTEPGQLARRIRETALAIYESLMALEIPEARIQDGMFEIPLGQYLRTPGRHIWNIVKPFYENHRIKLGIGTYVRDIYEANRVEVSKSELSATALRNGEAMEPWMYTGSDAFERYLKGLPMSYLCDMTVRIGVPAHLRPEHGVIVGKTGAGKSQLLEKLILADLQQNDPPGVIIIDSKADEGSLFNRIPRLDVFHPEHGRLRDRLIIVDPVRDKPALNMFSHSGELTPEKVNQINASMRYFFGGLLGDELSGQMNTLFLPLLHVILRVPGATLHDLQSLVRDPLQYPEALEQIPKGIKRFLREEFSSRNEGYRATKQSLVTRIQGIINEVTLDEMFSAETSAFDVAEALGEGKVILVSTNAQALQHLSSIFGKYWIAQTLNAGMSRKGNRPIHFYCDEAAPYVDDKLQTMLTTMRSYGLGVMLAFQGVWQMGTYGRAILGQTNIKFLSGADETDAEAFASFYKGMDAKDIHAVRKSGTTAAFAMQHSELEQAVVVRFPFGVLDREPRMSDRDYRWLRRLNATRMHTAASVADSWILEEEYRASVMAQQTVQPKTKDGLRQAMEDLAALLATSGGAQPRDFPPAPLPEREASLKQATAELAALLAKPRSIRSEPSEPEASSAPPPAQEDKQPTEPWVDLHYPDLPERLQGGPDGRAAPSEATAPASSLPADKITIKAKRSVRDPARPAKRRRKPDAPDTSGSKPTEKW